MRIGTIVSVDEVAKSNKLLKLTVDFGDHRRTILAGMKLEPPDAPAVVDSGKILIVYEKQDDGRWLSVADAWNSDLPAGG